MKKKMTRVLGHVSLKGVRLPQLYARRESGLTSNIWTKVQKGSRNFWRKHRLIANSMTDNIVANRNVKVYNLSCKFD